MLATMRQTAKLVEFFHKKGERIDFHKNDFIVQPGEHPPGIFYIVEGLVKAYDVSRYGDENLLIIRKEQEVFPLIWAITGQERKIAYRALVPTKVYRVDRSAFVSFMKNNPEVLAPLMDMTIEMYRLHSERILNLEYRSARERIMSFLLTMAGRFGSNTEDGVRLDVPLRHQDIASSVNASRETTTRELVRMARKGMIGKDFSRLVLKSPSELQNFLIRGE